MAIIETCLVDHNGEHGWGLISQGVLCPTISLCKSDGVAAALARHGYPGHTVLQWKDDEHSHDATRHKSVPWTRQVWPPGAAQALPPTVKEKPALFPPPDAPPVVEQPFKAQIGDLPPAVQVGDPPPRKSLLVRRPLVTVNNPPPRVEPVPVAPPPIPAPADTLNHGVLVAKAAPVAADTAADNSRVYGRPLTLAEKLAARKAGLL